MWAANGSRTRSETATESSAKPLHSSRHIKSIFFVPPVGIEPTSKS